MTLILIAILLILALFALFWGGGLVAQGFLYNEPAERLPLRAAAAALLVGLFLIGWVLIDRKSPRRYGPIHEFEPVEAKEFDEFDAVHWRAVPGSLAKTKPELEKGPDGKPVETVVKVHRQAGNKNAPFLEPNNRTFHLQEGGTMTGAMIVKLPGTGTPIRFDADLKQDPRMGMVYANDERRFTEAGGSRFVLGTHPGVMFVPSTGAVVLAILINIVHFAVWMIAFWLILRFAFWHAFGFTIICGIATMLIVMPLLFKPHRSPVASNENGTRVTLSYRSLFTA